MRETNSSFGAWKKFWHGEELESQFKKMKEYIVRLLKENKALQQSKLKSAASHSDIHQSYYQKKAVMSLLEQSSKQTSTSVYKEFQNTGSLDLNIMSPQDKQKTDLFNRLYDEAAKKREILEKVQEQFKDRELIDCTFKPEIYNSGQTNVSVFERLQMSDKKDKEDFYKKKREEKEMNECTFKPQTNSLNRSLRSDQSFDRLYKEAEILRQKHRTKEIIEKDKELENCTFKPSVTGSRRNSDSSPVFIKLYNSYQDKLKELRHKELEKKLEEDKNHPFMPKLLTPKKKSLDSDVPAYERLYGDKDKRDEKLKNLRDERDKEFEHERKRSLSIPRNEKHENSKDSVPRYENLYNNYKEIQEKKQNLKEKIMKDSGVSFKPDMKKSNGSYQAYSKRSNTSSRADSPSREFTNTMNEKKI